MQTVKRNKLQLLKSTLSQSPAIARLSFYYMHSKETGHLQHGTFHKQNCHMSIHLHLPSYHQEEIPNTVERGGNTKC